MEYMIGLLALVLFAPWFSILIWVYLKFPKNIANSPARLRFDQMAICAALLLASIAAYFSYHFDWQDAGPIWPQVIATLAAYHVFLLVLGGAMWMRSRSYRMSATIID
jgi:hypothetical protein